MLRWSDLISSADARHVILAIGGIYIALAAGRAIFVVSAGSPIVRALVTLTLVGGPGIVMLLVGYRLPQTNLHPTVYPRILAWCLGTFGVMTGIVGLRVIDPGVSIDNPFWSGVLATALGSVAALAIGMYEARAISRAREAEQRSQELERHSQELERQNERLESFAGMLAHELRNPLSIAQIYHQQEKEGDQDAASQVETALDRIEEMIDILLVTVRGTEANIDYESVALADVAADAWADLSPEVADLVVETNQSVWADPVHLQHLFKNVFGNAVEHSNGDVTVRVGDLEGEDGEEREDGEDVTDGEDGEDVTDGEDGKGFYIEDDGPGIPADERDEVAEPGYTTKSDGIGLGLTFVAELADIYDWNCTITESEAGGARFEFTDVALRSPEEGTVTARG